MLSFKSIFVYRRYFFSLSLLSTCSLVFAAVNNESVDDKPGSEIVITSTRVAQPLQDTLTPTTVITRQQIEQWQSRTFTDVLRHVPGVAFANNGGPGQLTSVFLRGSESDHVLVLIDGVAAGSVTAGGMAFQDLPLNQIERIEIARGPISSLYGSEAVGGVIQIFTRAPSNKTQQRAKFAVGSENSFEAAVAHQGNFKVSDTVSGQFNVGLAKTQTQGFNACRSDKGGCFIDAPDDDGYNNRSGNLHVSAQTVQGQKISLSALQAIAHNEYDGFSSDSADNVQRVISSELSTPLGEYQQIALTAGRSFDQSDNFAGDIKNSVFDTRRDSVGLIHQWQLGAQQRLTSGVDYRYDHLDSDTDYVRTDRRVLGGLLQYQQQWQQYSAQIGGRYDDNSQFGDYTTGNLRLGYQWNSQTQLHASIANAFKAPTFNDLYYPGFSNSHLKPEESVTYELGVEYYGPVQLTAALFQSDIDQLVAFDAVQSIPVNLSQARIVGQELGWQWIAPQDLILSGQFTWLQAENRDAGTNFGNSLPRRPSRSITFDVQHNWQAWSAGVQLAANSHRYDDLENTADLGGYTLVDLRLARQLSSTLQLQGSLTNTFDKVYETAEYFNQPGRALWLTLRYQDD